jgi:hypothetical protein
LWHM